MTWVKKGLIFKPEKQFDWINSHAQLPIVKHLQGDIFRIYFSGRDIENRSLMGYLEVDITDLEKILYITKEPILNLGSLGAFDDCGVSQLWLTEYNDLTYMYYLGWNRCVTVLASELTGLASSTDGGKTFKRVSRAPILERTDREPFNIIVATCVLVEDGKWRMWYDSADEWLARDNSRYNIKYAESNDGIHWTRNGEVCIYAQHDKGETCISRACVLKEEGIYKMWYCIATVQGGYKSIGYAESNDGIKWERKDNKAGMPLSETGWDSEMVCYPHVFNHKNKKYMLYNGNGYGRTGFGYAIWQE